jgi:hypothetical protein
MFNKKKEERKELTPREIQELKDEEALEVQHNEPKAKKPEQSIREEEEEEQTELTEEEVIKQFQAIFYRLGRIEHHLRLDF